jgi:processing peptidase subunit beta
LDTRAVFKTQCAFPQHPSYFTGSDVRVRDPDLPLLHFALAFKGAAWTDADMVPLMVMQSIIGAWSKNAGAGVRMSASMVGSS